MTRRTTARTVWLILSGLLIATGLNVALRERPFVSILIAAVFVGGSAAMLLPIGAIAAGGDADVQADLDALRKDLTR
jgi:hypothetical protein